MSLSDLEFIRYSRSLMLSHDGERRQLALKNAAVLVVGLGGLGSQLCTSLVGAGVGRLWLFDGDKVELSNLARQPLYQTADIGRAKAQVAAARLQALNPHPHIMAQVGQPADEQLLELLPAVQLVLDCSDNLPTRLQLNRLCRQQQVPLFSAAVSSELAQLYLLSGHGPCYQCLTGASQHPTRPSAQNCRSLGVDPALVLLAAQQLALLALQQLQGRPVPLDHYGLYRQSTEQLGFRLFALTADPQCACCAKPLENTP